MNKTRKYLAVLTVFVCGVFSALAPSSAQTGESPEDADLRYWQGRAAKVAKLERSKILSQWLEVQKIAPELAELIRFYDDVVRHGVAFMPEPEPPIRPTLPGPPTPVLRIRGLVVELSDKLDPLENKSPEDCEEMDRQLREAATTCADCAVDYAAVAPLDRPLECFTCQSQLEILPLLMHRSGCVSR